MDEFNPSLQTLVSLGNSYVQAYKGKKETISTRIFTGAIN